LLRAARDAKTRAVNDEPLPASWPDRVAFDLAHVWHPFTQMKEHRRAAPLPVVGAEGCDLVLADGRRVFDGVSSWWTSLHGHGHPRLVEAMARQARSLDHVMFAGFTHEPALALVARLRRHLPAALTRVFFSDNGSTSVEVALKMTFQAQHQRGERGRTKVGALRGAYHGDTLGAVGVGELENFMTSVFAPLLLRCERVEVPSDPRRELAHARGSEHEREGDVAATLERGRAALRLYFAEHGSSLAAFVCEPLVQGAGGMRMWPGELLLTLREECDRHGVYLVFDEVMTGFGRTGTFLACDRAAVVPDVLCLSKMLTGGMLPLSVTCATEALFDVFWGEPEEHKAFLHGHSYTANPIACAVAVESLRLLEETRLVDAARDLGESLRREWQRVAEHPRVRDARTLGAIAACRLVEPATGAAIAHPSHEGLALHRRALDHGLLVRPIGDCLYLMPPLATPRDRIPAIVDALVRSLDAGSQDGDQSPQSSSQTAW
jgi:adenosylmethionine-8-amino-7-oxononanoate aminotransferase